MGTEIGEERRGRDEGAGRHPTRAAILAMLSVEEGRKLSAAEIRRELDGRPTLSVVAYHLLVLLQAGLVRVTLGNAETLYSRT
jgi:hypothetical protein